jgi:predicted Fe-Mo cluster-binding NifX family protein
VSIGMIVCITAASAGLESRVDELFGHCKYFIFIDTGTMDFDVVPNTAAVFSNAGIRAADIITRRAPSAVLLRSIGKKAAKSLRKAGIEVFRCNDTTVSEALASFNAGTLERIDVK